MSLHYLVKYKMCTIHQYLVKNWIRVWSLIFWPILNVKLRFVLDKTFCVGKHKNTILSYTMGQKLSSKLLFIYYQIVIHFTYLHFTR